MRTVPLLPDEEMTPFQRISPLADCGNAFGRNAEPDQVQFINTDLVDRPAPRPGRRVDGQPGRRRRGSRPGIGLADALLFDDEGPVGRALQTLLLRPRAVSDDRALAADAAPTSSGPTTCSTDPDVTASYATDWTGRYRGEALLVVRPASTAEVAAVAAGVRRRPGAAIVPQGGNTGLVGGSVPRRRPMVVLSTSRLDVARRRRRAARRRSRSGPASRWRRGARHARDAGLDAPVDFASRDSATVGGAVATNAGGSRVVRFGTMRVPGRRPHGRARRRLGDRLARRAAEGDRRRPLAVAAAPAARARSA